MTTPNDLPELPEPALRVRDVPYEVWDEGQFFDADQIRAYGLACMRAGMERAARICEREVRREAGYGGRFEGYGAFDDSMTGPECRAAIIEAISQEA